MSDDKTTTAVAEQPQDMGAALSIYSQAGANHLYRVAKIFSNSGLIPQHFQKKPDDCFIALQLAQRMDMDPFQVLQSLYVVHGRPGFSAQFMIARANSSGVFKTPLLYREKGTGDKLTVTAYAIHATTDEEISFTASMEMARAEGWTSNKKYTSMPQLMLRYRAATMLIRTTCPEVTMGMRTREELQTLPPEDVETSPAPYDRGVPTPEAAAPKQIEEAPVAAPVETAPAPAEEAAPVAAPIPEVEPETNLDECAELELKPVTTEVSPELIALRGNVNTARAILPSAKVDAAFAVVGISSDTKTDEMPIKQLTELNDALNAAADTAE